MNVRGLSNGECAALIINECQNGMVEPEGASNEGLGAQVSQRGVIKKVAALAQLCRNAGVLVVHSTIVPRRDYVGTTTNCLLLGSLVKGGAIVEGRHEADIHPDLAPQPGDVVIQRVHGLTPFHSTELEPVLRSRGVQTVIVTGVSTNIGVPGICLDAVNHGYTAVVPEDCTAGAWPEAHDFQVTHTLPLLATVTTSAAVAQALAARVS